MIISHRHKFIFLKTQKTAGTSIEFALSGMCGVDDTLTPTGPLSEEHLRLGRGAQNYLRDITGKSSRTVREDGTIMPDRQGGDYFNHIEASRVKSYAGDEVWGEYFKFAFCRNPWDREVSQYLFNARHLFTHKSYNFDDHVMSLVDHADLKRVWDIITIDGKVVVDFVGRYESLQQDFTYIKSKLFHDACIELPAAKSGFRSNDEKNYRKFYSEKTKSLIGEIYAEEISEFGYVF